MYFLQISYPFNTVICSPSVKVSTLMYLLNRLYDLPAENGRITIGGTDVADMKGEWVRSHIGMVLQEPFLFSRTIAENIGITKKEIKNGSCNTIPI